MTIPRWMAEGSLWASLGPWPLLIHSYSGSVTASAGGARLSPPDRQRSYYDPATCPDDPRHAIAAAGPARPKKPMSPLWPVWPSSTSAPRSAYVPSRFVRTCTTSWPNGACAWSSCNQAAAGLKFFYTKTLGWDVLHLNLPPRTGRSQLPQVLSIEELQRLFTRAKNPRHRVLLMTTYAAGLRVSEVVRLQLTDIESDRDAASASSRAKGARIATRCSPPAC